MFLLSCRNFEVILQKLAACSSPLLLRIKCTITQTCFFRSCRNFDVILQKLGGPEDSIAAAQVARMVTYVGSQFADPAAAAQVRGPTAPSGPTPSWHHTGWGGEQATVGRDLDAGAGAVQSVAIFGGSAGLG